MKVLFSKRGALALAALLLALFLFRPGVYRLRDRIANSIGRALDRRVTIDDVHLRLLPRPGFDLDGLVIYDDPAFGPEPMIRAQDVSAAIRIRSLFHGRIELARLSATEPSINLVRNNEGRWNLAALLERSAQIPAAPTAKPAFQRRPAFPYLEATNARVNFKLGQTKKSFVLTDADVALWQASDNSWSARLKAQPIRTDFNLTDTGLLHLDATWRRAPTSSLTPLQIAAQWRYGQLGQISQMLTGRDRGWRGAVTVTAQLSGTPEGLHVQSQTAIEGFRRDDSLGNENVRLAAACSGDYDAGTSTLTALLCESPSGGGAIRLRGTSVLAPGFPAYDLALDFENVPLGSGLRLLRQVKQSVPTDLAADGLLNATFNARRRMNAKSMRPHNHPTAWTGDGTATKVRLTANADVPDRREIFFATIPLTLVTDEAAARAERRSPSAVLRIGPALLNIGTATANGVLSTTGFRFSLRGDLQVRDLFRVADLFGLKGARPPVEGRASVDVDVVGPWQGFTSPVAVGSARLRNVRAEVRGLHVPIEIETANVTLTPDAALVQKLSAHTGATHWTGTLAVPRHCAPWNPPTSANSNRSPRIGAAGKLNSTLACPVTFGLVADELSSADLADWFAPLKDNQPWYRVLRRDGNEEDRLGRFLLSEMGAVGTLRLGQLRFKRATISHVASQVEIDRGVVNLRGLRAELLQGTDVGRCTITGTHQPASYRCSGALQNISLTQLGALMNDDWITGSADGTFDVSGSGDNFRDLLADAEGDLHFAIRGGSIEHLEFPGAPAPFPVHHFVGDLSLKKSVWSLSSGRLESNDGIYFVSGSASAVTGVNFTFSQAYQRSYRVTGALASPQVEAIAAEEAKRASREEKVVQP